MTSAASIASETEEVLGGIAEDASGAMTLIHKTKFKDLAKRFRMVPINIDADIHGAFKESARRALVDVKDNAASITKFSDPTNSNSYLEMDMGLLPDLDALLDGLRRQKSFHGTHDFDEVKEKGISCYTLKSGPGQKRVFVFFNVGKNHLSPDKYIVSKFKGDKLGINTDELVVFESHAFAVYYEDIQKLLIISYRSTKKLLDFNEQFRAKCRAIFTGPLRGLVTIEGDDLDALLGDNATNEKIVKMYGGGVLESADAGVFAGWNAFYAEHPLEDTREIDLSTSGKASVRSRDDLVMVLRVLNKDIVEAVNSRGSFALATGKKELKVSRSAAARPSPATNTDRKGARRAAGRRDPRPSHFGARRAPGSKRGPGTEAA